MKSIISRAALAVAMLACLTFNVQARPASNLPTAVKTIAVSDTGKMAKSKMKMDKKKMKKDTGKMAKSKMKMDKMKKDTGKM